MTRPTRVYIDRQALEHNLQTVKKLVGDAEVIAMVKADAYGCGLSHVVPALEANVRAFGVACLQEAKAIRALGVEKTCILMQGFFSEDELAIAVQSNFDCVLHQEEQLDWVLKNRLPKPLKVWVKVNTGMNRLGFLPEQIYQVLSQLEACPWIAKPIGLMTHLASADEPAKASNQAQLKAFKSLALPEVPLIKSIANSAAILAFPESHADVVRPGIMLYGVSPFENQKGQDLGLKPVMHFYAALMAIHTVSKGAEVGYGGTWKAKKTSTIGIVSAGYGDGYPRHIAENTPVWINGQFAPIVGRVSMDMLAIDLTHCKNAKIGDAVELWGQFVPIETIAKAAGTLAYELLCQFSPRVA